MENFILVFNIVISRIFSLCNSTAEDQKEGL